MYEQLKLFKPRRRLFVVVVRPDDTTFKQELSISQYDYDIRDDEYQFVCSEELCLKIMADAEKFGCYADFEVHNYSRRECEIRIYGKPQDIDSLLNWHKVETDLSEMIANQINTYRKACGRGYYIADYWLTKEE